MHTYIFIYAVGCILGFMVFLLWERVHSDITLGDLTVYCMCAILSWILIIIVLIEIIADSGMANKVVIRSRREKHAGNKPNKKKTKKR